MTNIAFQDIAGGCLRVYRPSKSTKKNDRIVQAFDTLENLTEIKLFLVTGRKIRLIGVRRLNDLNPPWANKRKLNPANQK